MTDEFHEQPDPSRVQSSNGGRCPQTSATGSHEPRSGDAPEAHPVPQGERSARRKNGPILTVHIVPIPPETYPEFRSDREHPFAALAPAARVEEIDAFCGRLWARLLRMAVRSGLTTRRRAAAA